MTDYKELIKRREELREELANINNDIYNLRNTVFLGKLEKAVALLKEVDEAGIFDEEEIVDFNNASLIEDIIVSLKCYINIIKGRD